MKLKLEMQLYNDDGTIDRSRGLSWGNLSEETGKYLHDHFVHKIMDADDIRTNMISKEPHTCDIYGAKCESCKEKEND